MSPYERYDKKRLEVMAQGSSPTVSTAASDEWDHDWVVVRIAAARCAAGSKGRVQSAFALA